MQDWYYYLVLYRNMGHWLFRPPTYGDPVMTMRVIKGYPPNIKQIAAVFPGARGPGVIFSYGDRIFVPSGQRMPSWIVAHEEAHGARQREIGVDLWWERYLSDRAFALAEEIIGHKAEFDAYKISVPMPTWRQVDRQAELIAYRLSGSLYNKMMSMSDALLVIGAGKHSCA